MNMQVARTACPAIGTEIHPTMFDGSVCDLAGLSIKQVYFAYRSSEGLIVGKVLRSRFTVDAPKSTVWAEFKDFNRWQNGASHYYSKVLGESEGQSFRLTLDPATSGPDQYRVTKVIPEHLIILSQLLEFDGSPMVASPDAHVFTLDDRSGQTEICALLEHASRYETVEAGLAAWGQVAAESERKWRDDFVPTLRANVARRS